MCASLTLLQRTDCLTCCLSLDQVILGTVIGAVLGLCLKDLVFYSRTNPTLGFMFSHLMKFSHKRGFIDRESYVAQYLALAIFTTGVVRTIGSDDLLAAFAAGYIPNFDPDDTFY